MLVKKTFAIAVLATLVLSANTTLADNRPTYKVTITNITQAQTFTPILVTTHKSSIALFDLGEAASEQLEILAEDGRTGPFAELLGDAGNAVHDVVSGDGLLAPSESVTFTIRGNPRRNLLSLAAMLIPTNDTFMGLDSVRLPRYGSATYFARAYDAGTEANDQSCANIPGPRCGGGGFDDVDGPNDEGFVHVSNGFHELGDVDTDGFEILGPATYDWRNPVARITVKLARRESNDDHSDSDD